MDEKTIFSAIGEILNSERDLTDKQISSITEKLGDSGLIPRMAVNRLEAQKSAVQAYCDDILLTKSKLISKTGSAPYHLKSLDS